MRGRKTNTTREYEIALLKLHEETYVFRLFVAGSSPVSVRAITNIKRICEEHLKGRYELDIVDINQQPSRAFDEQLLAAPTLIKKLPVPVRRVIGDLSDAAKVFLSLDVKMNPLEAKQ